ncbi:Rrp7 protein [Saccharomycopsis crataegensis]|uniref:Rrp7 protein n=1 Tax=Saccharomycopsis crataegensis TaxID=43959 RepID=A0AAV5QUY5_9ASCO|nr:Rrp7 protein [Saccharomycopsis crataegensis]
MGFLKRDEIKGFKILPVRISTSPLLISKKLHDEKEVVHYVYFKQHQSKANSGSSQEKDINDKSIFVINLPNCIDDLKSLRNFFRQISDASLIQECDIVNNRLQHKTDIDLNKLTGEYYDQANSERVEDSASDKRLPFNTGLVTFVDKSSLKLFMSNVKKLSKSNSLSSFPILEGPNSEESSTRIFNSLKSKICDVDQLKHHINVSISNFNKKEAEEEEEIQNAGKIIDDDGFQLVVNRHRKTKAAIMGKTNRLKLMNNQGLSNDLSKKSSKKQRQDFYRFQIRERKKQEMNQLLMKFREDQARIKSLKERKRFRPY